MWHVQVGILKEEDKVLQQQSVNSNIEVTEEDDTNVGIGLRNIGRRLIYNAMHNNANDNNGCDNQENCNDHILMLKNDELKVEKDQLKK